MFLGYQAKRDCVGRYEAIAPLLDQFERNFTLIDLGAGEGYFGTRVKKDYDATVVLVEGQDLYKGPLMHIKRQLSAYEINEFAKGEHFDVVLCLSMLHHVPDWRGFLQGVFALGEHIFLEIPTPNDLRCFERPNVADQYEFLTRMESKSLGTFESFHGYKDGRRMLYIHNPKYEVENTAFYYERDIKRPVTRRVHPVFSSFDDKRILKFGQWVPWQHGVNLFSYVNLGGVGLEQIELDKPARRHGDLKAWNYVVQDWVAYPIDYDRKRTHDDQEGEATVLDWLRNGGRLW